MGQTFLVTAVGHGIWRRGHHGDLKVIVTTNHILPDSVLNTSTLILPLSPTNNCKRILLAVTLWQWWRRVLIDASHAGKSTNSNQIN